MARYYGGGNGFLVTSTVTSNIGAGDYSFHCWAKASANNADSAIFCGGASLLPLLYTGSTGELKYYDGAANSGFGVSISAAAALDSDTTGWYSIGVKRVGSIATLYVGGYPSATLSGATGSFANAALYFGADSTGGADPWDGLICECALWRGDIGDQAFQKLGQRYAANHPALRIPNNWRVGYWPVYGNLSPEPDLWGGNYATLTSGSMQSAGHPRIIRAPVKLAVGKAGAAAPAYNVRLASMIMATA